MKEFQQAGTEEGGARICSIAEPQEDILLELIPEGGMPEDAACPSAAYASAIPTLAKVLQASPTISKAGQVKSS